LNLVRKNKFKKDFKRVEKQGKSIDILEKVISFLYNGNKLDENIRIINYKGNTKIIESVI
jgi:mRNA-degrading endonuclease YafQ of YafQ-DinJ toxin-antitoxin module